MSEFQERFLNLLKSNYPRWMSVKELAEGLGKNSINPYHRDLLDRWVQKGIVERRIVPAGIATRHEYRAVMK